MKKLIILISTLLFANDTKEILEMIHLLNNKQIEYKPIEHIYNPFQPPKEKIKVPKIVNGVQKNTIYKLEVIFQNKVKINGSWYKNGDIIDGYTIIIKQNNVYLKDKNRLIPLNIKHIIKVK